MDPTRLTTLVLNRNWKVVRSCSVANALGLVYRGRAKIMDEEFNLRSFEDWISVSSKHSEKEETEFIRTIRYQVRVPKVIVLSFYDKLPKSEVQLNRRNVFRRDDYTCQYCYKKAGPTALNPHDFSIPVAELTLDHIVPRSKGGTTVWTNITTACIKCNVRKGSSSLQELGWEVKTHPIKPTFWSVSAYMSDSTKEDFVKLLTKKGLNGDSRFPD